MPSQPPDATLGSPSKEDRAIDLTAESTRDDDDDVEGEDWTQIPDPGDEEISNSDDLHSRPRYIIGYHAGSERLSKTLQLNLQAYIQFRIFTADTKASHY